MLSRKLIKNADEMRGCAGWSAPLLLAYNDVGIARVVARLISDWIMT